MPSDAETHPPDEGRTPGQSSVPYRLPTPHPPSSSSRQPSSLASQIPGAATLIGLAHDAVNAAKATPLLGPTLVFTQEEMARVEAIIWRQIRHRMNTAAEPGQDTVVISVDRTARDRSDHCHDDPVEILSGLLAWSVEQGSAQAQARLFGAILHELQPDEARILAALSDGTAYAVVHVAARVRGLGTTTGPLLLENASTVGRAAGVALPERVAWYVSHLHRLGLVRIGPESERLADTYEILLTETVVREAQESAPGSKTLRRSLTMSPLGEALWDACQEQQARRPAPGSPES